MSTYSFKDGPRAVLTPEWIRYIELFKQGSDAPHDCENLVHPGISCHRHNFTKLMMTFKGTAKVLSLIFLLPLIAKYR